MFDEICKPLPEPTIDQIMENGRACMHMLNQVAYGDKRKSKIRNTEYREAMDHAIQRTMGHVGRMLHYELYGHHPSHSDFKFKHNTGYVSERINGPLLKLMMSKPGFDEGMRFTKEDSLPKLPWHPTFSTY